MCLSNDCYIRVIHSLMTVLLEYIDLNEYSLLKMFVCFKFNESNLNIRNIRFSYYTYIDNVNYKLYV